VLQESPQPNVLSAGGPSGLSLRFWVLVVVTGVGAGLGGGILMLLLRSVQHFFWAYSTGDFLQAVEHAVAQRRILVLVIAGAVAGLMGWLLKQGPGGHAGELSEAIWFHSGELPLLRTIARGALSIVIVGMGASLGREAAPKQTGAAIASSLSAWARLTSAERRLLVACGAGAGMAAVYNVPFGGALFALEVLLGTLALPLVPPALTTSLIATSVSYLLLPDQPTYSVPAYAISATLIVWAMFAGPVAGLAAVIYVRAIASADSRKPKGWRLLAAPAAVFTVLGLLALPFPQLLGNGKDVVQLAYVDQLDVALLVSLLLLKPLATSFCLASGAPGGLFTPSLACGALLGGLLGRLWAMLWPGMLPGSCAIVGAGAVLAAATQGPVSAVVFMLELTDHAGTLVIPMLLAIAGAIMVARRLEPKSVYSARVHWGRSAAIAVERGTRFDRLISADCLIVSSAARYAEVLKKLLEAAGRPLYVVAERGELIGMVPPSLAHAPTPSPASAAVATAADFVQPVEPLETSMNEADVTARLREMGGAELPVIDRETGRLVGVARVP
jgi:chloride channel protein, CIC family